MSEPLILRDFNSVSEALPAALELMSAQDVVEIQEEVSLNEWVTVVRLTKGNTGR